jgi:AcrR family transcriptional regulator
MDEIQRSRLLAAMSEVACEQGAANATVGHVVDRAGVSRRTFYELFAGCDDCLLAALEHALACAQERVLAAYGTAERWSEQIRAALGELLAFLEDEPALGRLLLLESYAAGPTALERRASVVSRLARAVDRGRREPKASPAATPLTSEGVVGGALSIVGARMIEGRGESLTKLLNPLMAMIVLPYLGTAAARRELSRPAPVRARNETARATLDPLRQIPMRLTYRTMCVLTAVSEHPGGSNRTIGEVAGIHDQGQISKLLVRLKGLGLIENATVGALRGRPNAWKLTQRGREVQGVVNARGASRAPS